MLPIPLHSGWHGQISQVCYKGLRQPHNQRDWAAEAAGRVVPHRLGQSGAAALLAEKTPPRGGKGVCLPCLRPSALERKPEPLPAPSPWPPLHLQSTPCSKHTLLSSKHTWITAQSPNARFPPQPTQITPLLQGHNECLVLQSHRPHPHANTTPD